MYIKFLYFTHTKVVNFLYMKEEFNMTTVNKLEKALTSAEGLAAQLKTFSMDTDNQQAKDMFKQLSQTTKNTAQVLQSRLDFVKSEEPQYRE